MAQLTTVWSPSCLTGCGCLLRSGACTCGRCTECQVGPPCPAASSAPSSPAPTLGSSSPPPPRHPVWDPVQATQLWAGGPSGLAGTQVNLGREKWWASPESGGLRCPFHNRSPHSGHPLPGDICGASRGQATFGATQARIGSQEPIQGKPEALCPLLPLKALVWLWGQYAWYRPSWGSQQIQMSEVGKQGCPARGNPDNDPQGVILASSPGWGEKGPPTALWERSPYCFTFNVPLSLQLH